MGERFGFEAAVQRGQASTGCRPSRACPARSATDARSGLSNSTSASSCADPTCSISREPRLNEYTICTAVAPDDVFTVSTCGDIRAAGGGVETSGGPPGQVSGPGAFITGLAAVR